MSLQTPPDPVVFIVDDEPDVRSALEFLAQSVGLAARSFESAQGFLDGFDREVPGCLILDVRMPGTSGLELQERLNDTETILPVIMVSGHGEIPMAVKAMKAGAMDFLQKPFSDQDMLERVQRAIEDSRNQWQERQARRDLETRFAQLTQRERQVLRGVLDAKLNKVIASELDISTRTVEIHRARVMEKLGAKNFSALLGQAEALRACLANSRAFD